MLKDLGTQTAPGGQWYKLANVLSWCAGIFAAFIAFTFVTPWYFGLPAAIFTLWATTALAGLIWYQVRELFSCNETSHRAKTKAILLIAIPSGLVAFFTIPNWESFEFNGHPSLVAVGSSVLMGVVSFIYAAGIMTLIGTTVLWLMECRRPRITQPPQKVAEAEEKTLKSPDDAKAWSNLGDTYHLAGRLNDARHAYLRAVQLAKASKKEFEHSIALIDRDEVQDCLDRGERCEQRGDHTEALKAYLKGLEIDKNNAILWYNLGTVKSQTNDWAGASEALQMAIQLNPKFVTAWNSLGGVCLQLGDPEGAIQCCDRAITLDPLFKKPWLNRGSALMMLGRRDEAIRSIEKSLEIDPQYDMARNALKHYIEDT